MRNVIRRGSIATALVAGWLLSAGAVQAALGARSATVPGDSQRMAARLQTATDANHTISTLALPNGAAVREFTNAAGMVYAVTWSGPGKPDLRVLLGDHFAALQQASAAMGPRFRRMPPMVHQRDLVIETGGHMGYFWGTAYVPSLAPQGFTPADLK
jgi:hypothetical protein